MNRPNIVLLHCHDAGRAVQPYGWPVATPNLQRFAEQGVLFRKCFAAAPTCGPSRTAMLTGQYPHQVGMYGLPGAQGWTIDDIDKHLVHQLNRVGYQTVLAGCQHEVDHHDLSPLGYSRILDTRPQCGEFYQETIDHVERYLAERSQSAAASGDTHDTPFFLSIGLDEPHRNNLARPELGIGTESARFSKTRYYDPERLDARYTAPLATLPDLPEIRRDVESLYEGVRIMDEYMGRVLYAIGHYGLDDSTIVIVTTDHGIEFPGGKKTLSDYGTGVMLMMRAPALVADGGFAGGRVIEPIVSHLDLYPTLMDLIGCERPEWLEGESLVPLVTGRVAALHDEVFTEQTYHGTLEPLRAVRTERYKLIRRHLPTGPLMRHDGPSTPIVDAHGWYDRETGHEELFDLYRDPQEACNRITDPSMVPIADDLRERMDRWMARTDDCFVGGEFPAVPGRPAQQ
ncbi:MAG: sulfatase [Spirochaetaceae bacterium]|nr:MAG: sulfatase [Spirochaetaceae bacterium]